jgi:hypothetical protein
MRLAKGVAIAVLALGAWLMPSGAQAAPEPGPAWKLNLVALPTHLAPGTTGTAGTAPIYLVVATNVGAGDASGPVTLKATLPAGVTPIFDSSFPEGVNTDPSSTDPICDKTPGQTVTCTGVASVHPSRTVFARLPVEVSGSLIPGEVLADATASIESPGAETVTAAVATVIDTAPPPFGFLPGPAGLSTLFTEEDGAPALAAGSHPDQLTIDLGFPVEQPSGSSLTTSAGHPRDVITDLPPGVVINPNATGKRCTEVEFLSGGIRPGCPPESQIGMVTAVTEISGPLPVSSGLYNMVPPPGAAATVAFDAANIGIFVHLNGGVRSESDYGLYAESKDTLARGTSPIEHVQAQIWGNPSNPSHGQIRDVCRELPKEFAPCEIEPANTPLLTMPSACSDRLTTKARTRSWEEAEEGIAEAGHETSADATTVGATPTKVTQCSTLEFEPTFTVKPSTQAAESPAGVEMELAVPQHEGFEDEFGSPLSATSTVKDVVVTLPRGMALNPAAADGLQACSSDQIGLLTNVGEVPPHFSRTGPQCPGASKIGTVEVETPLLDHPLPGAVYVAKPYDNPFKTLLGAYVVIDSPRDGIEAKLAGRTEADPDTGQLTVSFKENPQLPVASFKVSLFGGPRAALRTPAACGTYTTTTVQAPWSGNPPAHTADSFDVTKGPNGKSCVSKEADMPHDPGFSAGTETPIAAGYSPFLARLTREDGEQQLKSFNMTLPAGLTGKLAGVGTCSDASIVAAKAKTGQQELASPSCPASSLLGKVEVGAGAGPAPYYTTGKIYMAGPYEGAPLSGVVITPAVAGPFDLGTVVVRAPAYVDSRTAQVMFKSDDVPHILEGVPLELRDARVALNRDEFTLNPTSCDPMGINGEAISLLNLSAPLSQRFQVGGCKGLDFKPSLSLRLKGGTKRTDHPKLIAVLKAGKEEANLAKAQVKLPPSAFLDQAHIKTICTRVQFAADTCPAGSIYGKASVKTPLFDNPLNGNVYLRSSNHNLPDLVLDLRGPASQPIKIEVSGKTDSVKGALRNTFEAVPDAPFETARVELFGGKRGLVINSRNLCAHKYRAEVKLSGQNGKSFDSKPLVRADCGKGRKGKHHKHRHLR